MNSSYCYILHSGSTVFTWSGSLTTADDQELVERFLDVIKVMVICFNEHNIVLGPILLEFYVRKHARRGGEQV